MSNPPASYRCKQALTVHAIGCIRQHVFRNTQQEEVGFIFTLLFFPLSCISALFYSFYLFPLRNPVPVPVAVRSKAWVCGHSPAEILGSNPAGGMDVCLL